MMVKTLALTFGLLLSFSASLLGQSTANTKAERIRRYERMGSGGDAIMEATLDLTHSTSQPVDAVVRVCSQEPLPLALSIAAMSPFKVARWMNDVYNYSPDRILFLRSEDCLGSDPKVAATELWAVPKGATLPAAVESVKSSQVRSEPIGADKNTATRGARNYRAAAQDLVAKLRARPEAVGIVLGYYYKQPSRVMKRKLREVQRTLKESGLSEGRYSVRLAPWTGEYGDDDPEPKYPSLFVVEVAKAKDSARK